jgi:lactoylglutathione lyase/methylmalonyl-CoA/ethylmalonyl-CoA epimerase
MIKAIDHIGFVVRSTEETTKIFSGALGFSVLESMDVPEQGFKSTSISKEGATIELIEPTNPEGAIAKFLEKKGEGLHHISLQVDDIEQQVAALKTEGVQFVSEKPMQVTDKAKSIFIHPKSTGGILTELIQRS